MTMVWHLWNCCRTKRLILFWFVFTLLIFRRDVVLLAAEITDYELCKQGEILTNYVLRGGRKAGAYYKIGQAANLEECIDLCCSAEAKDCHLAIFVKNSCFSVKCNSAKLCKPIKVHRDSAIRPSIFRRHGANFYHNRDSSMPLPDVVGSNITLKREKRYGSCRHYTGKTCASYLDKDRLIYYDETPSTVELRLSGPFTVIQGHFHSNCKKYALPALCLTSFPYCESKPHPQPIRLCREDCEKLYDGVCQHDFNLAKRVAKKYPPLLKIMPNCSSLVVLSNEGDDCVKLGLNADDGELSATVSSSKKTEFTTPTIMRKSSSVHTSHDYENSSKTKVTTSNTEMPTEFKRKLSSYPKPSSQDLSSTHHSNLNGNNLKAKVTAPYAQTTEHQELGTHQTSQPHSSKYENDSLGTKISTLGMQPTKQPENTLRLATTAPKRTASRKTPDNDSETRETSTDTKSIKTPELETTKTTPKVTSTSPPSFERESDAVTTKIKPSTVKPELSVTLPPYQLPTSIDNPDSEMKNETSQPSINPTEASPIHIGKHKSEEEFPEQSQTPSIEPETDEEEDNNTLKRTDTKFNQSDTLADKKVGEQPNLYSTIPPTKNVTRSPMSLLSSVFTSPKPLSTAAKTTTNLSSDSLAPTQVINTSSSQDELELDVVSKKTKKVSHPTTIKTDKLTTKAPVNQLHVSTVGDTEIVLPKDGASLYASAWPKESEDNPYSYQWLQIAAPKGSHGYMEGKNAQRVVLTQLTEPGIYQFKVIVKGVNNAYGTALVNVTVKKPQHVNKPPRADVSPKEQTITLPTNEVVLDGSKSSDDEKIVEYKWQELKGPLTEKDKIIKSGVDSPILQLKSLLPGVYTYKLTVKDSNGETDSVVATVTVNAEKDYPPVARAGNDVVITLPMDYVTLYGNGSTDDHGVKSYEWSKSPLSPPCDLQGTTESILHVSNMVEGDYTFTLKVTDTGDHSSESKVTVVVRPEKNSPPVAKAGDDKDLVIPDDSTHLNAKESHDDQGISRYHWEKVSGPSSVQMDGVDKMILSLSHLTEGHYLFKLTVYDSKGLTGTDTVSVNVKRDGNQPPKANAGPDVIVKLPNRAAALDGSKSSDDYGIVKYSWTRDLKSPAAGDIVNGSNHQAILRLSNLVKGVYKFRLTVKDVKGLDAYDDAEVIVKEDENSPNLIELYLDVDVTSFSEENKRQLVRKLAVYLNVMDSDIVIEHIQPSGRGNSLVVLFYVKDSLTGLARNGKEIADLLKQKLHDNFFEFKMEEVEPYVCRNNCSGHGYCDQHTKQCICESFWMQDPFKAHFGLRDRNCDWSILYVIVIIFGVIVAIVGITWGICFCLGRTKSRRRRQQYSIVNDEDSDDVKNTTMELFPRGKYLNSSMMSETDMDTDEETLFENQKPYKGSRTKLNGMINGTKNHHT